jgi:ferredoxin-thioredoxin reductase catalytic subunit
MVFITHSLISNINYTEPQGQLLPSPPPPKEEEEEEFWLCPCTSYRLITEDNANCFYCIFALGDIP